MEIERNGNELILHESSLITSKTDLRGCITYANFDFMAFSGYNEEELIGRNHNLIRHPLMPRIIFKILWDTIQNGKEINAFVLNKNKEGLEYWVYANVTPSFNTHGNIIGYYSVRRKPNPDALPAVRGLYTNLTNIEKNAKAQGTNGMSASYAALMAILEKLNMTHQVFFITMQHNGTIK
ncbi:PAS domain S-box protein [Helicobacter trogontum]|uniref:PAS domain S-box protein n=1 Tax=Helicobacter trogontum TaxID=50960 RepID=A0A4V6I386_9HELI|nr:PAS domain S-box protein [Helicobacter trogontum]MDY5184838.1 PAS domain S-box protein [Helicobacter trogontum]TLD99052.1 PAS domain S-box protein [Helicobacter trogontum]